MKRNYQKEYALLMKEHMKVLEQMYAYQSMLDDALESKKESQDAEVKQPTIIEKGK